MSEIDKLRTRLKNVNKKVTEYRMSVQEAQALLTEIDVLLQPKEKPPEVVIEEPIVTPGILDAGNF